MNLIEFFQQNTGWLKDLVSLIFAATATILAILTYRRAKASILQPMRSEVLKKQTEYLTAILELIYDCKGDIDYGLNYADMFGVNCDLLLNGYNFQILNEDELKEIGDNFSAWIQFLENDPIGELVYIQGNINDYVEQVLTESRIEYYFNESKKGNIEIHSIVNTKQHQDFLDKIKEFASNPFLPHKIHELLNKIVNDIKWNTHVKLRENLQTYIANYAKEKFLMGEDGEEKLFTKIEYQQLMFREFKKERKSHYENFGGVRQK